MNSEVIWTIFCAIVLCFGSLLASRALSWVFGRKAKDPSLLWFWGTIPRMGVPLIGIAMVLAILPFDTAVVFTIATLSTYLVILAIEAGVAVAALRRRS